MWKDEVMRFDEDELIVQMKWLWQRRRVRTSIQCGFFYISMGKMFSCDLGLGGNWFACSSMLGCGWYALGSDRTGCIYCCLRRIYFPLLFFIAHRLLDDILIFIYMLVDGFHQVGLLKSNIIWFTDILVFCLLIFQLCYYIWEVKLCSLQLFAI